MSKVLSGAKSLFTIGKNAVNGVEQHVPKEVTQERINICNSCNRLSKIRQCKECLCFVDAKTKYKQEHCPLNKWLKYEK